MPSAASPTTGPCGSSDANGRWSSWTMSGMSHCPWVCGGGATGALAGSFSLKFLRPPVAQQPGRRLQHQVHPVPGDQVALAIQVRRHPHPPHLRRLHQRQVRGTSGPSAGRRRLQRRRLHRLAARSHCLVQVPCISRGKASASSPPPAAAPSPSVRSASCSLLSPIPTTPPGNPFPPAGHRWSAPPASPRTPACRSPPTPPAGSPRRGPGRTPGCGPSRRTC